jgi:hypothetical protein
LNIQEDSIQKFWTEQVEHTGWFHPSSEPDMKNRQVRQVRRFWTSLVCSTCQYFMSGSKLGWNHPVYSTWMEIPCMFSLSGLSCPFTIHKHEINFSFRLIAVLFSN